jgi:hypothetical protein
MNARQALTGFRAPDECGAEQRAWDVVRGSYVAREAGAHKTSRGRPVVAVLLAIVVGAFALSPAGAAVGRLVGRALGVPHAAPVLADLPATGRLLLSGPGGAWTVADDGSTRRLGAWSQASWSPHARYAAVVSGDRLVVINPRGVPQWTLARPAITDPRWYSPSGYRVAYLSGDRLRVVAGDGSGDHLLATAVARVAPAWRPAHPYELAYLTGTGRVVLRDADTGGIIWSARAGAGGEQLAWRPGGQRLVLVSRRSVQVFAPRGGPVHRMILPAHGPVTASALSPDGRILALVLGGSADMVVTSKIDSRAPTLHRVLIGVGLHQVDWSPDGRWLLISWPTADQWVFVRVQGAPRIAAVSRIAQTFAAGASAGFPQLDGWCCTAPGARG